MRRRSPTNLDLLDWFSDNERKNCASCAQPAAVSLPETAVSFCLGCGAIAVAGLRLDVTRSVAI